MSVRTFVVSVSASPDRVVVEDVRTGRRAVTDELATVGGEIAELLEAHAAEDGTTPRARVD
jgi:hypothetical protein